jgi:hypothetical protein
MPFTFAHPAAVLPLHAVGRRLPLSALVVGSMMPDIGYFFAPTPAFLVDNHTLAASFTFCLPWGVVVLAILTVLEVGWSPLLPESLRPPQPVARWRPLGLPLMAAALVLGAWTHDLWDAWTHASGWFVERTPALQGELTRGMRAYGLLQYLSTFLGAAALAFALRKRLRLLRVDWRLGFWAAALVVAVLAAFWRVGARSSRHAVFLLVSASVRHLVLIALGGALIAGAITLVGRAKARTQAGAA